MNNNDKDMDIIPKFKGCNLDELRYRRAYALAKYEMAKMRTVDQLQQFTTGIANPTGIMGRIFNSLNYFDYALLAYRIGSKFYKWRQSRHR